VAEVADELACDWHTVNGAVCTYGEALLEADRKRMNRTSAIGLDETSFVRLGTKAQMAYATTIADVEHHQIIDILPSRTFTDVAAWLDKQPKGWKERIRYGALVMSSPYWAVYSVILPKAIKVIDPFHVISLANRCLDPVRRRVQSEQTGHRAGATTRCIGPGGSCSSARRSSTSEHPSDCGRSSLWATPTPRSPSPIGSKSACATSIARSIHPSPLHARGAPAPLHAEGHTTGDLKARAHHQALVRQDRQLSSGQVSNWPTEPLNNLIKRIKRIAFRFRNFENYRIERCSTRASRTGVCWARSWSDEGSTPRQIPMSRRTNSKTALRSATPSVVNLLSDVEISLLCCRKDGTKRADSFVPGVATARRRRGVPVRRRIGEQVSLGWNSTVERAHTNIGSCRADFNAVS